MKLRPATLDDAQVLFNWRNDLTTRKQSKHPEEVLWENHILWLTQSLLMSTRKIYMAEQEGALVSVVRSDRDEEGTIELSWTISSSYRGKGLGQSMVIQFVKELHPNEKLRAIVLKGNIPSEKIAEALGLHQNVPHLSKSKEEPEPFRIWC